MTSDINTEGWDIPQDNWPGTFKKISVMRGGGWEGGKWEDYSQKTKTYNENAICKSLLAPG